MSKQKNKPEKDMEPLKAMGHAFQDIFQKTADSVNEAAKDTSDQKATIHSVNQSVSQTDKQSVSQSDTKSHTESLIKSDTKSLTESYSLTPCQHNILEQLYKAPPDRSRIRFLNLPAIAEILSVPVPTVRNTIRKFISKGIFTDRRRSWRGTVQGLEFQLNEDIVEALLEGRICLNMVADKTRSFGGHSLSHSLSQTLSYSPSHSLNQSTSISSKDFIKHTTRTEKEGVYDLEAVLRTPEVRYWTMSPNNLTARQLMSWVEEFGVSVADLVMYLDYCRYDMVENGRESKIETKKTINYFYGVMRRKGLYAMPEGYMTMEELRLKDEEEIVKRKETANRKLEELLKKSRTEDYRAKFLEIFKNPDCEEYKELFSKQNKEFINSEKVLMDAMWTTYAKEQGIELEDWGAKKK